MAAENGGGEAAAAAALLPAASSALPGSLLPGEAPRDASTACASSAMRATSADNVNMRAPIIERFRPPPGVEFGQRKVPRVPVFDGNEVQSVTILGSPTGGTFTLTWNGQTTAAIAYNADAATVQAALRLLAGLELVTVSSTGTIPNFVQIGRAHV